MAGVQTAWRGLGHSSNLKLAPHLMLTSSAPTGGSCHTPLPAALAASSCEEKRGIVTACEEAGEVWEGGGRPVRNHLSHRDGSEGGI